MSNKVVMVPNESKALLLMFYTIVVLANTFLPTFGKFIYFTSAKLRPNLYKGCPKTL